jgi:hypothetical protein
LLCGLKALAFQPGLRKHVHRKMIAEETRELESIVTSAPLTAVGVCGGMMNGRNDRACLQPSYLRRRGVMITRRYDETVLR